jgi:hypothetical protein
MLTKQELTRYCGDLSQIAGVRFMTLADGPERGVRIADVRSGSGLRFQVSLDRGMDISLAEYRGFNLALRTPSGDVHPSHFDARGRGWLRTFPGGLMTGCGMTYAGAPCVDEGTELGLHGRLSHLSASDTCARSVWEGDECCFRLEGSLRESTTFGENLHLRRSIETRLGESVITLRDRVRNEGTERTPLMMLYHVNAGWPVVERGTRLLLKAHATTPRDGEAAKGIASARLCSGPEQGYREQVFYHDLQADQEGYAAALLHNAQLHLALFVRFRQAELPRFIQWKMMGEGTYVVGMEPANCFVTGRSDERKAGTLSFLSPGDEREFHLELGVLEGEQEIARFAADNNLT